MKALITGASSGIGYEMSIYLSNIGYDLILVSRNIKNIDTSIFKTNIELYSYDLEDIDNCYKLYNKIKNENINILINNAGFGIYGTYKLDNLDKELNMIELNIKSMQILTRLLINNKSLTNILNVSSTAGLLKAGPLMNTYYATKKYIVSYSLGLYEELRRNKSQIHISVLCPGRVLTNFNTKLGIPNNKGKSPKKVAKYAIKKMLKNKLIIIPGIKEKIGIHLSNLVPTKTLLKIIYNYQKEKTKN